MHAGLGSGNRSAEDVVSAAAVFERYLLGEDAPG
jgi:hypothetical protein